MRIYLLSTVLCSYLSFGAVIKNPALSYVGGPFKPLPGFPDSNLTAKCIVIHEAPANESIQQPKKIKNGSCYKVYILFPDFKIDNFKNQKLGGVFKVFQNFPSRFFESQKKNAKNRHIQDFTPPRFEVAQAPVAPAGCHQKVAGLRQPPGSPAGSKMDMGAE